MIALWDLGNVVVDWNPEKILQDIGYDENQTLFIREQLFDHQDWLDIDRGVTSEEKVARRLHSESSLTLAQVERCFDVVRQSLVDIERTVELLHEIHALGIPMYVLSNMGLSNAAFLRQRDYFKLFDGVVISAEEKLIKPEAALFQRTIERYQLPVAETLFIDDSLPNIEMALQLGLQAHHFHRSEACYQSIRKILGA